MAQPLGGTEQGVVVRRNAAKNGIGKVNAAVVKAVGSPPIQGVVGSQQIQRSIVAGGISAFYKAKTVVKDFHSAFVFFICPEGAGEAVNQSRQTGSDTACGWNQRRNCFPVGNDTGFNPLRIIGADLLTASLSSDNFCAELAIHILGRIGVVSDIQCRVLSPLLGNEKSLTRGLVRLGEYGIVICCYHAGACASRHPTA